MVPAPALLSGGDGLVTKSCLTLGTPWTVALQSPVRGILQARILDGVGCRFLFQRIFPTQESNPGLLCCRHSLHLSHKGIPLSRWLSQCRRSLGQKKWKFIKGGNGNFPLKEEMVYFPSCGQKTLAGYSPGSHRVGRNLAQAHTPECLQPPPPPSCSHLCEPAVLKQLPLFTLGARFPHQGNHRMDP